jgi:phage terminase large subunit
MPSQFPEALDFLFEPARYKVAWGGRGAAKSWGFARAALVQGGLRTLRILCARETQRSIADSVQALLGDQVRDLGLDGFYRVQQATILGKNGSEFIFHGLKHNINNIKSLEGCDVVWVEEAQSVSKDTWEKLIPTIRKPGSEIWITFNPELETDETYARFVVNPPPGAVVRKLTWRDNPWFPDVLRIELEHLRDTDFQAYLHVWEGETKSSVEGAVYGAEIAQVEAENRVTEVPCDRTKPVDTFWDLGFGDETAIWFAQVINGQYRLIDYLSGHGKTIEYYLIQLQQRGYLYGQDWLPHDGVDAIIHARLSGNRSMSIEQLMRAAGRNVRIAPKMLVHEGINAVRTIFPSCYFDRENCTDGLRALKMYQWGQPSASGLVKREPLHDSASHGADAFRTLAVAHPVERRKVRERKEDRWNSHLDDVYSFMR